MTAKPIATSRACGRWVRRHAAGALALLLASHTCAGSHAAAQATDAPISEILEVDGGGACLDAAVLAQQVASWLGRDRTDARLAIRVEARGEPPAAVEFVVEVDGERAAERQFAHPPTRCEDIRAAVALAIALAIDASILEDLGIGPVAESRAIPRAPSGPRRMWVALEAVGAVGVVPELAAGGEAGWEVAWSERFNSRVGVFASLPVATALGAGDVEEWLLAARFDACLARALGGDRMRICAGPAAGVLLAQGRGFDSPRATGVPWVAVVLRIDARFPLGAGVDLGIAVDGLAPVVRPRLVVEGPPGTGEVAAEPLPPLGLAVALGPAFAF